MIRIGTAGWGIPRASASALSTDGTHLQRYASGCDCVEINSSFYRPHRRSTYERWAASTPASFRFAVKMPKVITHESRLQQIDWAIIDRFLDEASGLGRKLGVLLLQMPKSLEFDPHAVHEFLASLRERWSGPVVCEPRHASWFTRPAERLIDAHSIGRVAADPAVTPSAAMPRGNTTDTGDTAGRAIAYYRWHGSPKTYWSPYSTVTLERLAVELMRHPAKSDVWCIFDNTATGSALANALELKTIIAALRNARAGARKPGSGRATTRRSSTGPS
jgi:uncharacterized protein YecE (DUF72 family)